MAYLKWLENGHLKKQSGKYLWWVTGVAAIGYLAYSGFVKQKLPPLVTIFGGIGIMFVYVSLYVRFFKKHLDFEKGFRGEAAVAKELCKLPAGFLGFHDVKLPGRHDNIDFVEVTPTHVYALEVKNMKRFPNKSDINQAKQNALLLNKWINQEVGQYMIVQAVVVSVNKKIKLHSGMTDGAGVVRLEDLNSFIMDKSGQSYGTGLMIPVVQALKRFTPVHEVVCD